MGHFQTLSDKAGKILDSVDKVKPLLSNDLDQHTLSLVLITAFLFNICFNYQSISNYYSNIFSRTSISYICTKHAFFFNFPKSSIFLTNTSINACSLGTVIWEESCKHEIAISTHLCFLPVYIFVLFICFF